MAILINWLLFTLSFVDMNILLKSSKFDGLPALKYNIPFWRVEFISANLSQEKFKLMTKKLWKCIQETKISYIKQRPQEIFINQLIYYLT